MIDRDLLIKRRAQEEVLFNSVKSGNPKLARQQVLHRRTDPQCIDKDGKSPLMVAAECGQLECANVLLSAGVNVNQQDPNGDTALFYAVCNGHEKVTSLLLERGADKTLRNNDGWSSVVRASQVGQVGTLELLLNRYSTLEIQKNTEVGWVCLRFACQYGHNICVEVLLSFGLDVNVMGENKITGLLTAAECGHAEVIKVLLSHGANVNHRDKYGRTPLILAAISGHTDAAKALINGGADIGICDDEGNNAEHYARTHVNAALITALTGIEMRQGSKRRLRPDLSVDVPTTVSRSGLYIGLNM